jgi:hypothetical protein
MAPVKAELLKGDVYQLTNREAVESSDTPPTLGSAFPYSNFSFGVPKRLRVHCAGQQRRDHLLERDFTGVICSNAI